jgi:hypothetical protein
MMLADPAKPAANVSGGRKEVPSEIRFREFAKVQAAMAKGLANPRDHLSVELRAVEFLLEVRPSNRMCEGTLFVDNHGIDDGPAR